MGVPKDLSNSLQPHSSSCHEPNLAQTARFDNSSLGRTKKGAQAAEGATPDEQLHGQYQHYHCTDSPGTGNLCI